MASRSCITTCDERPLDNTSTWAIAVVCFVLVAISLFIEQLIHRLGEWLWKKQKRPLYEALEKIKSELMLLGFISLFLTVVQDPVSKICISKSVGRSWHPCEINKNIDDQYLDPCRIKGKLQFASKYAIHQLHIFIFVLAVAHVLYCITTLGIGKLRMRTWRAWEDESKTIEYQFYNDPERFRFARDTSFGRRHLHFWSNSPILLWIVCFFRQFYASVEKVDYLTLRHGFAMAHLAPQQEKNFDFQLYINRALEEDFTDVVGISPVLWMFAVLYFVTTTNGWYSYYWLPFIPLIIILLVGTKLQVIITKMGVIDIQEKGEIVKGAPLVEPGDDLFWFNRPALLLFLIHFSLFQNAYQLAFFVWSWWKFNLPNCFHKNATDIAITLSMGVLIQILCSYVTLPLYALVTQMGSTMKPVIFGDDVASAIRTWHQTAKQRAKNGRPSENVSPRRSRAASPLRGGSSPVHQKHGQYPPSPSRRRNTGGNPESSSRQLSVDAGSHEQSEIEITLNDFSLGNKLN